MGIQEIMLAFEMVIPGYNHKEGQSALGVNFMKEEFDLGGFQPHTDVRA